MASLLPLCPLSGLASLYRSRLFTKAPRLRQKMPRAKVAAPLSLRLNKQPMPKHLFLAGASGAVGRPLIALLLADGWSVTGTTRSAAKAQQLTALGIEAAVVDVFDAAALRAAVLRARPDVVVHQLTDLPPGL